MKTIEWDDSLVIGIQEIDEQHRKLITLLNNLSEVIELGKHKEIIRLKISEVMQFTVFHFNTEEKMFKISKFDAKVHIEEHQKLIKKAKHFAAEFEADRIILSGTTVSFFMDWILNHITQSDDAYAKPLIKAGYK